MVEYLSGNRIQGSSTLTSAPPQTSWKELKRVTLSSAGTTIDTGTFTAKDNMMILSYDLGNTSTPSTNGARQFNGDDDDNYSSRHRANQGGSNTATSDDTIQDSDQGTPSFDVQQFANIAGQEKLVIGHQVIQNAAGAGTAPSRVENVGKWANTSNAVTSYQMKSDQNFNTNSEIVVLGADNDEADSGTNFWQELSSTVLTATHSGALTIPQFTTKKYLMITYYINASTDCTWKVGTGGSIDSGNNYHNRYSSNGAGDSTLQYTSFLQHNPIVNGTVFIINKSDQEKLMIQHETGQNQGSGAGGSGAGNAPNRREDVGKWANTSGQIDTLQYDKSNVSFYAGTFIKVYGAD